MLRGQRVLRRVAGEGAPSHGEMQVAASEAGVSAGLSVAAGAHERDAERGERVAQRSGLARAQDEPDPREVQAERADHLHKVAVVQRVGRLKSSGGGAQPRQADREMRLPACAQQMVEVRGQRDGLLAPVPQAEEHADADAAEPGGMPALGAGEAPVVILLRSRRVDLRVGRAVVCLLVDDEPLGPGGDQRLVIRRLHRRDLDGKRRNLRCEHADDLLEVSVGDKFRMLAGDEQNVAEALRREVPCLRADLLGLERDAQDGVLPGKAAVDAAVDAFVGQIEGREQPYGPPEVLPRQRPRAPRHILELGPVGRRQVARESSHRRGKGQADRCHHGGGVGKWSAERAHRCR